MYLIALLCDEPCGFAMYCIWNKHYNIRGILKSGTGNTNCCVWDYNCIHIPHQSCMKMCLQLIGSHSVASVNACLCQVSKMIIYDQSKSLPHTKYILINLSRRASEIAVLHLRNPNITESSTSQRWVLHLPPKIQSVRGTKLRLCRSRFSYTLFLLPISICVYTYVSVWRL